MATMTSAATSFLTETFFDPDICSDWIKPNSFARCWIAGGQLFTPANESFKLTATTAKVNRTHKTTHSIKMVINVAPNIFTERVCRSKQAT